MGSYRQGWALSAGVLGLALSQAAQADFIGDSKADLELRTFYENLNNRDADKPSVKELGQGGIFKFKSGFTEGPVGFGVDAIGLLGLRLDGGGRDGKPGSRAPSNDGIFPFEHGGNADHSFGKAGVTGKALVSKTELDIGTLMPSLPVARTNDGRLLPQIYQGGQLTSKDLDGLTLTAGRLNHTKTRASTDDVPLSISGSAEGSNKFYFAGGDWQATENLKLQYYYGQLQELYRQHFLGLTHAWALPVGSLNTDLRYFHSGSDGNNGSAHGREDGYLSNGYWRAGDSSTGEVDNDLWSALFTYGLQGHEVSLGYQHLSGDSDFPWLNQGGGSDPYLITNMLVNKFSAAGERIWQAGYAYNFKAVGLPGLKASVVYNKGDHIATAGQDAEEWERDFRIDYKIPEGPFKGLGLTYRNGKFKSNDSDSRDEHRLYLSYTFSLL